MNTFGRALAIILTIILIIFFPLQYLAQNQKTVLDNHVQYETRKFADEIMLKSYISMDMYAGYMDRLDESSQLYDVEMIRSEVKEGFDTGSKDKASGMMKASHKQNKAYGLTSRVAYPDAEHHASVDNKYPILQIKKLAYHKENTTDNKIESFAAHIHTDACYGLCTGYDWNNDGVINWDDYGHVHYYEDGNVILHVDETCMKCGAVVKRTIYNGRGDIIFQKEYPHNRSTTNLVCDKVVTSVTPTKPNQTIKQGQSIVSTAEATYLDGHKGIVNCGYNFNSNQTGSYDVTLVYSGLVDNGTTEGQKTCITRVTVLGNKTPVSLMVTPSSNSVYNGNEPVYAVRVNYDDNTNKIITDGYSKDGFTEGAGTKTVSFSYTENGKTVTDCVIIVVKRNLKTCINGHTYELDDFDNNPGCPVCKTILKEISVSPGDITIARGSPLNVNVTVTYMDNHTEIITSGWSCNLDRGKLGKQVVTVCYKGMDAHVNVTVTQSITCPVCGTMYPSNEDGSDPGCPVCKSKVVSISAAPDTQVVNIKENMKTEVTATYQDGHKEIVKDWTSNFNSFQTGKQQVTISYQAKSTTVTVIVQSETETTCPICGDIYNPSEHPYGCPKCSETVAGIEARLRNGGIQVQYGSELNLYVILIYKDNHRAITYNDWSVEGYQADKLGIQAITVKYKEFSTTFNIEIVNTLIKKLCPNGHVYYLNEDGSDPGCPYCNEDPTTDSSKGYLDNVYTKDILKELYDKGIYYLNKGDYITITVRQKNESLFMKLQSMLHFTPEAETKKYIYGGMVGNGESI